MKFKGFATAALALAALCAGPALAQVTMQPIPNPPEKAKATAKAPAGHHHKGKHHHKHAAGKKAADATTAK